MDKFIKEYGIKKSRNQVRNLVHQELDEHEELQTALACDEAMEQSKAYDDWLEKQNPVSEWDDVNTEELCIDPAQTEWENLHPAFLPEAY